MNAIKNVYINPLTGIFMRLLKTLSTDTDIEYSHRFQYVRYPEYVNKKMYLDINIQLQSLIHIVNEHSIKKRALSTNSKIKNHFVNGFQAAFKNFGLEVFENYPGLYLGFNMYGLIPLTTLSFRKPRNIPILQITISADGKEALRFSVTFLMNDEVVTMKDVLFILPFADTVDAKQIEQRISEMIYSVIGTVLSDNQVRRLFRNM